VKKEKAQTHSGGNKYRARFSETEAKRKRENKRVRERKNQQSEAVG